MAALMPPRRAAPRTWRRPRRRRRRFPVRISPKLFPSAAEQVSFLAFLAPRSAYWLNVTVLAGMHILLLLLAYAMLRSRVLH